MIIDKLENYNMYHFGSAWKKAFEFLNSLSADSEDKKYQIQGDDVFALVMSYKTAKAQKAILESHRDYVDVQTVLVGAEGFECFMRDELVIDTPYDSSKDAEFYKRIVPGYARVDVAVGTFVALYPHDAHMAGLMIEEEKFIKKVVVKIKKDLLLRMG
jgi:biofilm protein TabA